jgi:ankyrin repeat protein
MEIMKTIRLPADPNIQCGPDTPLSYAIMWENIDMIKILLDKGANLHWEEPDEEYYPTEDEDEYNPDLSPFEIKEGKRHSALGYAIETESIVKFLLERGADPFEELPYSDGPVMKLILDERNRRRREE